jgi:pheromone shutdown-related protein TraB
MVNFVLASYQKRLGMRLGVTPGSELLEATKVAEEHDIPISLCDRDIRVTLRRAWGALSLWRKMQLLSMLLASSFESPELTEEQLRELRQKDVITELMDELGEAMPDLKRVLIDERDAYLAQMIRESSGNKLVAVVGAGHVSGMEKALLSGDPVDKEAINVVPPISPIWRWIGWGIPAAIVGSIAYIGYSQGGQAAGENALFWFLANAIPSAIGGILAFAHPVTIAAAFVAAPFTSLTPVIGAGYVAAFVQIWMAPPMVHEFQSVGDDLGKPTRWWQSRLLRLFLVFFGTTVGSVVGTYVGGFEIFKNVISGSS